MANKLNLEKDIEKLKAFVKKEFDEADKRVYGVSYFYDSHILPVYKIAVNLAEKYGADKKIVAFAALLHDMGLIDLPDRAEHNIEGAKKVSSIISALNIDISKEEVDKIKDCVLFHYGRDGDAKNEEIKVIITADALAHITTPFFFIKYKIGNKSFEEFKKWAIRKIDQDVERVYFEDEKKGIEEYAKILRKMLT